MPVAVEGLVILVVLPLLLPVLVVLAVEGLVLLPKRMELLEPMA
jgi:hypothetical protein